MRHRLYLTGCLTGLTATAAACWIGSVLLCDRQALPPQVVRVASADPELPEEKAVAATFTEPVRFVAWGPHDLDGRLAEWVRPGQGGRLQFVRVVYVVSPPDGPPLVADLVAVLQDGKVTRTSLRNRRGDNWQAWVKKEPLR